MCLLHSDNSSFILQKKMLSCLHFWNIIIDWLNILPIYKSCTDPSDVRQKQSRVGVLQNSCSE